MNKFKTYFEKLKRTIVIEEERLRFQFINTYIILGALSLIMTIINVFTHYDILVWTTLGFTIANIINIILWFIGKKAEMTARILFAFELMAAFAIFLISGQPEGFSALWSLLLPVAGIILYKRKYGSLLSLFVFIFLAISLWVPWKDMGINYLQYDYSDSFRLRFPILFLAFYVVGLFFENIRVIIQNELTRSMNFFENLSFQDNVTGLGNVNAYYREVTKLSEQIKKGNAEFGVIIMDVNLLKYTNDTYGHIYGTELLVELGKTLPTVFKTSSLIHLSGDEFLVFVEGYDYKNIDELYTLLTYKIEYREIEVSGKKIIFSVSSGYSKYFKGREIEELIQIADEKMYMCKERIKKEHNLEKFERR